MKVVAFHDPLVEQNLLATLKNNEDDMFARYRLARAFFDAGKTGKKRPSNTKRFSRRPIPRSNSTISFCTNAPRANSTTCCLRLVDAKVAAGDTEAALKYAKIGAEAAIDNELKVQTAIALADMYDSAKDGSKAIKAYRRIITEIPDTLFAADDNVQTSSHYYAGWRIGELIAKYGRSCYAAFDTEAEKASAAVLAGPDKQSHIAFLLRYPNSLAANKVAKNLADIYEQSGFASMALLV